MAYEVAYTRRAKQSLAAPASEAFRGLRRNPEQGGRFRLRELQTRGGGRTGRSTNLLSWRDSRKPARQEVAGDAGNIRVSSPKAGIPIRPVISQDPA